MSRKNCHVLRAGKEATVRGSWVGMESKYYVQEFDLSILNFGRLVQCKLE